MLPPPRNRIKIFGFFFVLTRILAISSVQLLIFSLVVSIGCQDNKSVIPRQPGAATAAQWQESSALNELDAVESLRDAISGQRWKQAETHIAGALILRPNDSVVLTNAALVNAKLGQLRKAAELMVEAARASGLDTSGPTVDHAVRALLDVGHLYEAIDFLEEVIAANSTSAKHRRMLIGFLGEAQLTDRIAPHIERLIRDRQFDLPILIATTEMFTRRFSEATIAMILARNPADRRPRLGLAQQAFEHRDDDEAALILLDILKSHPQFAPAHAMMGQVLVDQSKFEQLATWLGSAPPGAADLCDHWLSLGDLAGFSKSFPAAVRAYGRAIELAPNNPVAWARLGNALRQWQQMELQSPGSDAAYSDWLEGRWSVVELLAKVDARGAKILELRKRFHEFGGTFNRSQTVAVAVAEVLFELGRTWEAEAWSAIATTLPEDLDPDLVLKRTRIVASLAANKSWFDDQRCPELAIDFSALPVPTIASLDRSLRPGDPRQNVAPGKPSKTIRLVDEADDRGLRFFGKAGDRVNGPFVPLSQTLGCGGAAIDFDNDGQTDLYFSSAGGTPGAQDSEIGAMFRNVEGAFIDVTATSGVVDHGFGQGVSAGDYNDDGFVDLWMLNLGVNRLFRNNGDGTFSDVTESANSSVAANWSSSGAILDIDGDGFNDLIAINYCDTRQGIGEPCFDEKTGQEVACHPLRFYGSGDEFIQGRGNGTFVDVSDQWTGQSSPGRGLGIIAGKLDGKQMGIYVANDMSANDFYVRDKSSGIMQLKNTAIASGVAVDAQTLAQASMGMATSDLDNDGDLDFYITGFAREYNVVYEQRFAGSWSDSTAKLGLVTPTLPMVGFGTIANDLDGDCVDELLVTNGHIGDFGVDSPPYAQPFQLFRRNASGQFMDEPIAAWGGYFSQSHVGRAMWTLDVDSEGRSDIIITHENEPVTLLMNRSEPGNYFVGFRIVGTQSSRDAIGAIIQFDVPLVSGVVTKTLFQLAGSGYLCSTEKTLRCGTGNATQVDRVRIIWPDGRQQELGSLPTQCEYLVTENEVNAFSEKNFNEPPETR